MTRRHVLVIDDDPVILRLLATVLDLEEFQVSTASDGHAGLAAVQQKGPDVVVCDVVMPGVDGHEVCRRIKSDPATVDLPVVLLTAHGGHDGRAAGEAAGCDAYLAKPFRPLELLEVVRGVRVDLDDAEGA